LYGHELEEDISPIEAALGWVISKRRKEEGGFLGFDTVKSHLKKGGCPRKRIGFFVEGAPAREGAEIFNKDLKKIGVVTSGAPSPILKKSIGMGYVEVPFNKNETELIVSVRNKH